MTKCRTHESGGASRPARAADPTRTGSGASRAASLPDERRRALAAMTAARRAQPPDITLLRRVRDGLKRL
jgi:hypothetical protein